VATNPVATNPTVRQRELGKRLRELRLRHGLTVDDVAEKLLCSATKIWKLGLVVPACAMSGTCLHSTTSTSRRRRSS
jgi:hypothetical protein